MDKYQVFDLNSSTTNQKPTNEELYSIFNFSDEDKVKNQNIFDSNDKEEFEKNRKKRETEEKQGFFSKFFKSSHNQEEKQPKDDREYIEDTSEPKIETLYTGTYKDCVNWCEKDYFKGLTKDYRGVIGIGRTPDNLAVKYEFGDDGVVKTTYDNRGQPKLEETLTWDEVLSGQKHLNVYEMSNEGNQIDIETGRVDEAVKTNVDDNIPPAFVGFEDLVQADTEQPISNEQITQRTIEDIVDEYYDVDVLDEQGGVVIENNETPFYPPNLSGEDLSPDLPVLEDVIVENEDKKPLPEYENCFVSVEGFCGLYDDGEKQSLNECIEDITADHVDDLIEGKHVLICDADGRCIAECSISEDSGLDVNFYKLDRVEHFELAPDVVERIEESRNRVEEPKTWDNDKNPHSNNSYEDRDDDEIF